MNMRGGAQAILDFWFDAGGADLDTKALMSRWFGGGRPFDVQIRERFGAEVEAALDGGFRDWETGLRSRLALLLLLDQFPRNIFRGTARAFAGDDRALRLARATVDDGELDALPVVERIFVLMPYQHAEDRAMQQESLRLFGALVQDASPSLEPLLRSSLEYAREHCDIVMRFGRFPYRNAALGRESTAEEARWLAESAPRFGQ